MSSLIVEVCKITNIRKHNNADKLSLAECKGWQVIIGLDQYQEGDFVTFIPPDCVLPLSLIEEYKLEYLKHNGRTGTVKLRGEVSNGLVLPVPRGNFKEGDSVAEALGITKYEQPERPQTTLSGNQVSKKKLNPLFSKYTDIDNIKNFQNIFKEGDDVVVTEKIHGSNSRFGNLKITVNHNQPLWYLFRSLFLKYILGHKYEFVVGSHNIQKTGGKGYYPTDVWNEIAIRYGIPSKIPRDTIIYGEIFGTGIQDLTYGIKGIDMVIFDIKQDGFYMDWRDVVQIASDLGIDTVPLLYAGKYYDGIIGEYTTGKSLICPSQMREGIVIKSMKEEQHPVIGRKILKSVSEDYLLRKNATEFK